MKASRAQILSESGLQEWNEYKRFRQWYAERRAPLVVFLGSGLSAPSGLPTWATLRQQLDVHSAAKVSALTKLGNMQSAPQAKLQTARRHKDFWIAFKLYREILGTPEFVSKVREALTPPPNSALPMGYKEILRLKPRGLLTVNLDRFAADALAEAKPATAPTAVHGLEIARRWEVIQYTDPFLVYLHGTLVDSQSWVLTSDDLKIMLEDEAHHAFLTNIYLNYQVLFVGISVDDVAVSGQLIELRRTGFRPQNLFWLTHRREPELWKWAEQNWLRIIHYAPRPSHEEVLAAFAEDCLAFKSEDDLPPPIISTPTKSTPIQVLSPTEAAALPPDEIRKFLTAYLSDLLSGASQKEQYELFEVFIREYARAVHNAFFVSDRPGENLWFGNTLHFPPLGEGTFGHVYQAETSDGSIIAIKIMREGVHNRMEMLGGFRRGVRSMGYLAAGGVEGMVKLIDKHEIPPTILMERVPGYDLDHIISSGTRLDWLSKLYIIRRIAEIVRSGHLLMETVMHRDLKPSNIMLRNFDFTSSYKPEIIILDFDMSWHKGSEEKDIVFEARDDFAYLAPEQSDPRKIKFARSTLVDSYGFGMTSFFLFGGEHPQINGYLASDWLDKIQRATRMFYDQSWLSAPTRLARLIHRCTSGEQEQRPDFGQIIVELSALEAAVLHPEKLIDAQFWAEEFLCRLTGSGKYDWFEHDSGGSLRLERGLFFKVSLGQRRSSIIMELGWQDQGTLDRSKISKYLEDAMNRASSAVSNSRWKRLDYRRGSGEARFVAEIGIDSLAADPSSGFKVGHEVLRAFSFA